MSSSNLPDRLPLFPLNTVLFPGSDLPLRVFEDRYKRLLDDREGHDPAFGVVLIASGAEVGDEPAIHLIGTAASINEILRQPSGDVNLVVRGGRRFRVLSEDWSRTYLEANVQWLPDLDESDCGQAMVSTAWSSFIALANAYLGALHGTAVSADLGADHEAELADLGPAEFAYLIAQRLPVSAVERQELLTKDSAGDLLRALIRLMARERRLVSRIGANTLLAGRRSGDEPSPSND